MKVKIIIKDAVILFFITIIAGALLGFVYELTKDPIAKQKKLAKEEAYQIVFQDVDTFEELKDSKDAIANARKSLDKEGFDKITIDEVFIAKDKSGNQLGYVVTVTTGEGYAGSITLLIGMKQDGTVNGIEILSIKETAGLGQKAKEPEFKEQFSNKKVESFSYTKTGKKADNEIDALSGATITTSAITKAVNAGVYFINVCMNNQGGGK